ncbi:MAG: hypothetical protein AAGF26_17760, partial [Cyanobacteria bacterium P01_G01_bin.49]
LLDEHINLQLRTQILRRYPNLEVWCIGDPNAPSKGTDDPDILIWCEENGFILALGMGIIKLFFPNFPNLPH